MLPTQPRRVGATLSLLVLLAVCLACVGSVDGDRASTGECPPGETCSDATPLGLSFVGHIYFDEEVVRLGPVLVDGTFEVGLVNPDPSAGLPAFRFEAEDGTVLTATRGTGVFGPQNEDGTPLFDVDDYLVLRGEAEGVTRLRVLDAATGELLDRLSFEVYRVSDVRVTNVADPTRDHLLAGCEQMVGVTLVANDGTTEVRAFDQAVDVQVTPGTLRPEPRFWDCLAYDAPADATVAAFTIEAGGEVFERTMAVRSLEDAGLAECPPVNVD